MLYSSLLLPLLVTPALAAHVPRNPKRGHAHVDINARNGDVLIEARGPSPELRQPKAKRVVKKKSKRAEGLCVVPGTNTTTQIGGGAWAGPTTTASGSSATASPSSTSTSPSTPSSSTAWSLDEAWVSGPQPSSTRSSLIKTARKHLL